MQVSIFIFSAIAFLLLLFSINLFLSKQGSRLLNCLLSIVLAARFFQIVIYLLIHGGEMDIFPSAQKTAIPFYFISPACFYLYVRNFTNDQSRLNRFDWLHFVPALAAVLHVLPLPFVPEIDWSAVAAQISVHRHFYFIERTGLFSADAYRFSLAALTICYLTASWYALFISPMMKEKKWNLNKRWIFIILIGSTVFKLLSFFPLAAAGLNISASSSWLLALKCIALLLIFIFVLHQPRILYGYLLVSAQPKPPEKTDGPNPVQAESITVKKAGLMPSQLEDYKAGMTALMEKEKPFLDPGFQI